MSFFGLFNNGPYMAWAKQLPVQLPSKLWSNATYQIIASPGGLPMVQLDLQFQRWNIDGEPVSPLLPASQPNSVYRNWYPSVANPDMSLVLLMDRSLSMMQTFKSGHVYNLCANVLAYVAAAGVGYDLIFYDDSADYAGYIETDDQLKHAIAAHEPRGGTKVTEALRLAVNNFKRKRGLYAIVVTDGVFQDKVNVQNYLVNELLPLMTPDNPYAFRMHFVGAGEGADERFLQTLEGAASGQGVAMVTSHRHAHLSHSHGSIIDELDRAFIGFQGMVLKENNASEEPTITKIGNLPARLWVSGASASFDFVPRHVLLGLEFKQEHQPTLPLKLDITLPNESKQHCDVEFNVPMPKATAAASGAKKSWMDALWLGQTPEQRAAREALAAHARDVYEAELRRQEADLIALSQGGIPVQAQQRLTELAKLAESGEHVFSSNLAPDEIALLRRKGYKVRGLVSGSAMYQVGQSYASATNDCEVTVLSNAYDAATALAISRMEKELLYLGAHGAVGVRLNLVRHEWGEKTIEMQAFGTAIEGPESAPARPWLSDLSGQEWYALHRAGYEPVALVYGHCAWFILTTLSDQQIRTGWSNQELTHWSTALSTARHRALQHVLKQTKEAGGIGVTGVNVARKLTEVRLIGPSQNPVYEREHHNLVVTVIGTAIRLRAGAPKAIPQTTTVLSLKDGRLKPMVVRQAADLTLDKES